MREYSLFSLFCCDILPVCVCADLSLFYFANFQEKSGTYQGAELSSTWFKGSLLPHSVLPKLPNSVQGMFLEAALVILEKLGIQCNSVFLDNCHWCYVWCYLLEQGRPDVSLNFFILTFICFCFHHLMAHLKSLLRACKSIFFFGISIEAILYFMFLTWYLRGQSHLTFLTDTNSKTWSIFWELPMLLFFSLEVSMLLPYNLWLQ